MTDKVLFVDDEQNILKALERLFADEPYETEFCNDPLEALKRVAEKEYAVVVSDHRMPQMEGIAMLGAIRQKKPDISRIVLTGYADMKSVLSAINDGNVYQFITKPWDDSALKLAVKQGLEHYRLIAENRELLELTRAQNIQLEEWNHKLEKRVADRTEEIQKLLIRLRHNFCQLVQVMLDVMELFDPYLAGHSRRVAELVVNIGKHLDLSDEKISRLETAAKLHDIGLLSLPRSLIGVRQSLLSPTDSALLQKHTRMGKELLGHIEELEQVATIIYHHHENWDGSGYPEKLSEEQIPLPGG